MMDFSNALKGLKAWQCVRRTVWSPRAVLRMIDVPAHPDMHELFFEPSNTIWVPTNEDILADDWELV